MSNLDASATQGAVALSGLAAWLPRRFLLAVDIMLDLAFNGATAPMQASELGERQGLPSRNLEAILQRLGKAGLVRGVRGPSGGYILGRDRGAITVGAVARAVLDADKATPLEGSRSPSMRKVVLPMVGRVHDQMLAELDKITLGELCRLSRQAGLESKCDGYLDFVI